MSSSDGGNRDRRVRLATLLGYLLVGVLVASIGTGLAAGGESTGELRPYDPTTLQAPQLDLLEPAPEAPAPPPPPAPLRATLVSGVQVPADPASSSLLATEAGHAIQVAALTTAALILAWSARHRVRRWLLLHGTRAYHRLTGALDLDALDRRRLAKLVRTEPGLTVDQIRGHLGASRLATLHHVTVLEVGEVLDRRHRAGHHRVYPAGWEPPAPDTRSLTVPPVRWQGPGTAYLAAHVRALTRSMARGTAVVLGLFRKVLERLEAACREAGEPRA